MPSTLRRTADADGASAAPGAHERWRDADRRRTDRRQVVDRRHEDRRGNTSLLVETLPAGGAALHAVATAIGRRALVTVIVAALVSTTIGATVVLVRPDRHTDALTLGVAGRQRMLSQQMAVTAVLAEGGDVDARRRLAVAFEEFELAHRGLRTGDGTLGVERTPDPALVDTYARPGGLDDQVAALGEAVAVVVGATAPAASVAPDLRTGPSQQDAVAAIVAATQGPLLDALEQALAIDQRGARARGRVATWHARLGVALVLLVLAAAAVALHRPVVAELRRAGGFVTRLEVDARRSEEWHRRFSTLAAHELRTPVAIVSGLLGTLRARWDELDESLRREVVTRVADQGEAMSELVADLSLIAGLAADPVCSDPWPLHELVEVLVDSHGVAVEVVHEETVTVDRRRLVLVLRELVDNAQRYGDPPVSASVRVDVNGDVIAEVVDAGDGVPSELVDHVLWSFTRAAEVDNHSSADGHGIGLAVVAGIAAEVGGNVDQHRGAFGCRWVVTFPAEAR